MVVLTMFKVDERYQCKPNIWGLVAPKLLDHFVNNLAQLIMTTTPPLQLKEDVLVRA